MDSLVMEGILKKWTNYYYGWQPRWFRLKNGFFSYVQSSDKVKGGYRGGINVASAEISAHPTDSYRLDVVIPGECYFYLKASSAQERQQWLVALGSAKTCHNSKKASQLVKDVDERKRKLSELRLYYDLVVQQVHLIKQAVIDSPSPDIATLEESSALLGVTCDTLIRVLDDCMKSVFFHSARWQTCSSKFGDSPKEDEIAPEFDSDKQTDSSTLGNSGNVFPEKVVAFNGECSKNANDKVKLRTFFSEMGESFSTICLDEDGLSRNDAMIPTKHFLNACSSLTSIFDQFEKLAKAYECDMEYFTVLQRIVQSEINSMTTEKANSATDALLWLKRGIRFLRELINYVENGENTLTECANKAYNVTLKRYHTWVIRGIFRLASNALPDREHFLRSLCLQEDRTIVELCILEDQLTAEMVPYLRGIDYCLRSLDTFYITNNLDPDK